MSTTAIPAEGDQMRSVAHPAKTVQVDHVYVEYTVRTNDDGDAMTPDQDVIMRSPLDVFVREFAPADATPERRPSLRRPPHVLDA